MRTKKGIAAFLAAVMIAGGMTVLAKVQADEVDAPYLALGADLT